ncbi:hypothetical protein [Dactylosporangium sp. CA-092794]|uniref:hypothetical protein n=1 Tax=Dactylosporangium sp. CA-092794 TaxID=3239929 RepID=UPI003D92B9E4
MLRALDRVDWAALSHAYGPADDTPALLRQAGSADGEVARAAVSELYGSIFHQGTVYPATVAAVPFLTELARTARHDRAGLVWMLGGLADPRYAYGPAFPDVRAAVAAQLPALLALLPDDDPAVREAAAYAAAWAGTPAEPLWQRWRAETGEAVRASLALALGAVDPVAAEPELAGSVLHAAPEVRVAAAIALLRVAKPWPDGATAAIAAAIDDGAAVSYHWAGNGGAWSEELLVAPPAPVAAELLGRLLHGREPGTRTHGLWAAAARCDARRSAPAQLVEPVAACWHDPDPEVRRQAVDTLRRAGRAAGRFADLLAGVAAGFPEAAAGRAITPAHAAIGALARLGDPRWIDPVCAAAAAGHPPAPRMLAAARREPALLEAIRRRLAAEPARADVLAEPLGAWRAAEAVPELLAALPHAGPPVVRALLRIGHDDVAAVPYLREQAAAAGDLAAALAVHRMTGDPRPLRDLLHTTLSGTRWPPRGEWTALSELGDALLPLLPTARERITGAAARTHPEREAFRPAPPPSSSPTWPRPTATC